MVVPGDKFVSHLRSVKEPIRGGVSDPNPCQRHRPHPKMGVRERFPPPGCVYPAEGGEMDDAPATRHTLIAKLRDPSDAESHAAAFGGTVLPDSANPFRSAP